MHVAAVRIRRAHFFLFCILTATLVVLNFYVRRIAERAFERLARQQKWAMMEQQMHSILLLSEQTQKYEERIFRVHHDIKNHLGVIRSMLLDGNQKQAEAYIKKLWISLRSEEFPN